jgi:hypothetical protein
LLSTEKIPTGVGLLSLPLEIDAAAIKVSPR